jgi:hypothetical protein
LPKDDRRLRGMTGEGENNGGNKKKVR